MYEAYKPVKSIRGAAGLDGNLRCLKKTSAILQNLESDVFRTYFPRGRAFSIPKKLDERI